MRINAHGFVKRVDFYLMVCGNYQPSSGHRDASFVQRQREIDQLCHFLKEEEDIRAICAGSFSTPFVERVQSYLECPFIPLEDLGEKHVPHRETDLKFQERVLSGLNKALDRPDPVLLVVFPCFYAQLCQTLKISSPELWTGRDILFLFSPLDTAEDSPADCSDGSWQVRPLAVEVILKQSWVG